MDDKYTKLEKRIEELERQMRFSNRLSDQFTKRQIVGHEVQYKVKVYDKDGVAVIN